MTTPTPTPNSMPGAAQSNPNPQLQEPVSTSQPPAQPQQEAPAQAEQRPSEPPVTGNPPPGSSVPDENWRDIARKHEARAKEFADKAKKWEEYEATQRTREEQQAIELQQARERAEKAEQAVIRERIARETGVLPDFLTGGSEEEMRSAAAKALEWRGPQQSSEPPRPQTAAVPASTVTSADKLGPPNGVQQLTREQFVALPEAERMQAVRAGACTNLGIGKPQEKRRMGNQLELGASGGRQ